MLQVLPSKYLCTYLAIQPIGFATQYVKIFHSEWNVVDRYNGLAGV